MQEEYEKCFNECKEYLEKEECQMPSYCQRRFNNCRFKSKEEICRALPDDTDGKNHETKSCFSTHGKMKKYLKVSIQLESHCFYSNLENHVKKKKIKDSTSSSKLDLKSFFDNCIGDGYCLSSLIKLWLFILFFPFCSFVLFLSSRSNHFRTHTWLWKKETHGFEWHNE